MLTALSKASSLIKNLVSCQHLLKYYSELLLSIPEAISQISVLLEDSLPLFTPNGRFHGMTVTPSAATRLESAQSSLLEAFALVSVRIISIGGR
jgi:hypothetical protein